MAFDPASPTFYGESYPVDVGRDITGTAIASKATGLTNGAAVTYLYDDDFTQGADAGDSILFGVYPDRQYLQADSDVVFSVVVELAAGSSGTFRLSVGVDPAFDLTSPALCTETLGTFTAAPGQVVADVGAAWTAAAFVDGHIEPLIFLEVLTGSLAIRQVRVRAWPPQGVSGAWTSDPSFEMEGTPRFAQSTGVIEVTATAATPQSYTSSGPQAFFQGPGVYGGFDDLGDTEGSFGAMVTAMAAEPLPTFQAFDYADHYDGISGRFLYNWALHEGVPGHDWKGKYELGLVLIMFQPEVISSRQTGTTNFTDPDRIPWESAATVRDGLTGGTLHSDFGGWTASPTVGASGTDTDHIGVRVFGVDEPDWDQQGSDFLGGRFYRFYYDAAGLPSAIGPAPAPTVSELTLPDVPVVGIEVAPRMIDEVPSTLADFTFQSAVGIGSFATAQRGVGYSVTRVRHVVDNVQFFDPAAVPVPTRRPRFFVTYSAVEDDPKAVSHVVGIGKPAEDVSLFRVPTPLGTYRELRHGEKVSDVSLAHPLKVKLADGSFTIVAGMTLDA